MAEHGISDTAFLTSAMRSSLTELSGDDLAELWVTPGARRLLEEFRDQVDPLGERIVSLRNRFFLDRARAFFRRESTGRFVSIAAGFTNYAHLFDHGIPCLEIDFPDVVEAKQRQLCHWVAEGRLADRPITYLGTDLALEANIRKLVAEIAHFVGGQGGQRAFVLLEGIVYYLRRDIVDGLLRSLAEVLAEGSIVGLDFWKPAMAQHPIFHRLQAHFAQGSTHPADMYFLFDEDFLQRIPATTIEQCLPIEQVEALYTGDRRFTSWETIFPDWIAVLRKQRHGPV
jgi:O-methyltransferase involved in polyketide biosynthesis